MNDRFSPAERLAFSDEVRATMLVSDERFQPVQSTWVQVARTGEWLGHSAGSFEFNADVYKQIVMNFQGSINHRIPVDFEHGAEAVDGGVYQKGAPAQAWVTNLRYNESGLEALFEWVPGQPGLSYVKQGAYRYVSPAVVFNATDAVSGKTIGAELVSVALTNRPFLDGLRPLAAKAAPPSADVAKPVDETVKAVEPLVAQEFTMKLVAEKLGCDAEESACLHAIEARESDVAALTLKAKTLVTVCSALGLEDAATEADVTAHLIQLTAKAARVDAIEPELVLLRAEKAAHEEAEAKAEVEFIVKCGKSFQLGWSDTDNSRKMLLSARKANPEAFAAEYKAVLDSRKHGDPMHLFQKVTVTGGPLAEAPAVYSESVVEADDPFEREVAKFISSEMSRGREISPMTARSEIHNRLFQSALGRP